MKLTTYTDMVQEQNNEVEDIDEDRNLAGYLWTENLQQVDKIQEHMHGSLQDRMVMFLHVVMSSEPYEKVHC